MSMRYYLFLFLLVAAKISLACKCNPVEPISKEVCAQYDAILLAHVDSVTPCVNGSSIAFISSEELYKGNVNQQLQVEFDCASSCLMSFEKGEKWLLYANYKRFDLLTVSLCGNSRKFFTDETQDFYALQAQRSFNQEAEFLKKELGIQAYTNDNTAIENANEVAARNEQPSGLSKLILLGISLLVMIIIFYFTRKKNDK